MLLRRIATLSIAWLLLAGSCAPCVAQELEQPPLPMAAEESEPPPTLWRLNELEWDFAEVAAVYQPVKGTFDASTRTASWTLELVRDLLPGEAGFHTATRGTPFRPVLLDAERVVVSFDAKVALSPISGTLGDRVVMTVQLPEGAALANAARVRIERRTEVGFPVPPPPEPALQ
jgi:hypothetical protein